MILDTNALLWFYEGSARLGLKAKASIIAALEEDAAGYSAISVWELAVLVRKGRYRLEESPLSWRARLVRDGFKEHPINGVIAAKSQTLEGLHDDPADRFIVATSMDTNQILCTADKKLLNWLDKSYVIDASI